MTQWFARFVAARALQSMNVKIVREQDVSRQKIIIMGNVTLAMVMAWRSKSVLNAGAPDLTDARQQMLR
ncbi:hypothetical protein [Erwinia psidii]|uniref:Uncharacterized protein n=1 Tax=Erwinia psidii TaxID=69224 RepID=A0A3N6SD48_9GAMM|nr:hypothetical protein [Erwinia psidii]MCX8956347.1 hypothetical protein [Erwinia psidii]MCX8959895.1 hypothetical protein [Erwinia psidii]MCX8967376.1 hypothetical protein [Erwinia psidii]RQM39350.1 hypothetical protein EB241_06275 [Erwinia psidii]